MERKGSFPVGRWSINTCGREVIGASADMLLSSHTSKCQYTARVELCLSYLGLHVMRPTDMERPSTSTALDG